MNTRLPFDQLKQQGMSSIKLKNSPPRTLIFESLAAGQVNIEHSLNYNDMEACEFSDSTRRC